MAEGLSVKLDMNELQALYADLRKAGSGLTVELRRGVTNAVKPLVAAVKAEAGFSSRIPATVQAKTSFAARKTSVSIVAGGPKAPGAAPVNNKGRGGTFKHPVFGRDAWVPQAAHPLFTAPIRAGQPQADRAMLAVLDDVARKAGFR